MATAVSRPVAAEYASYYGGYVSLVKGDGVLAQLTSQIQATVSLLSNIDEEKADYRYEPGKWSIREVLGHMIDAERIFAYRALRFSRYEPANLPGFEQDNYVCLGPYAQCKMAYLIEEVEIVRKGTLCVFRNMTPEMWSRGGVASDNPMTVRAVAYVLAGHELRHVQVLKERYLTDPKA